MPATSFNTVYGNKRVASGSSSVTGSATIATGLETVENVVAVLEDSGAANEFVVLTAKPSSAQGSIDLRIQKLVLTEGMPNTISKVDNSTPITVNWEAVGY